MQNPEAIRDVLHLKVNDIVDQVLEADRELSAKRSSPSNERDELLRQYNHAVSRLSRLLNAAVDG